MPIVNCDAKALEIYTAAWYYQDTVMLQECRDGVEFHTDNQLRFNLPTRESAKPVGFLILYGGTEYSLAADPKLTPISTSPDFWAVIIDKWYEKYKGVRKGHQRDINTVIRNNGLLVMPHGREYFFERYKDERTGEYSWPVTKIKNYPIQGSGATFMAVARVSLANRMKKAGLQAKNLLTVHDSIVVDCPTKEVDTVVEMMYSVFDDLPKNIERCLAVDFQIPMRCEVQVGSTYGNMVEIKRGITYASNNR